MCRRRGSTSASWGKNPQSFRNGISTPPRALTLWLQHFILLFAVVAAPARLYLPEFSVRSLACQTRLCPEVFERAGCLCLRERLKTPHSEANQVVKC